jgi:hypothetical protein
MVQIVLDIFLLLPLQHLILHLHLLLLNLNLNLNLLVVVLVQFMVAALIVIYQNLTKLVQTVLGMFLHNLSVVALEHNMAAVLMERQLKQAHKEPIAQIILNQ